MNTILGVAFAVLVIVLIIGSLKTDSLAKKAYKRDEEFKSKILRHFEDKERVYLIVRYWYDKESFTYDIVSGGNGGNALAAIHNIEGENIHGNSDRNKEFAIVNVVKVC